MQLKDFEERLKLNEVKNILLDYERKFVGIGAGILGVGAVMGIGGGMLHSNGLVLFGNNFILWGMIILAFGLIIGELRKNGYLKKGEPKEAKNESDNLPEQQDIPQTK